MSMSARELVEGPDQKPTQTGSVLQDETETLYLVPVTAEQDSARHPDVAFLIRQSWMRGEHSIDPNELSRSRAVVEALRTAHADEWQNPYDSLTFIRAQQHEAVLHRFLKKERKVGATAIAMNKLLPPEVASSVVMSELMVTNDPVAQLARHLQVEFGDLGHGIVARLTHKLVCYSNEPGMEDVYKHTVSVLQRYDREARSS